MSACTCTPKELPIGGPVGAKLRRVDELGREAVESLHLVSGRRLLRPRVVQVDDRVKVTVAEAADSSGDVALDADGARLIYPGAVGGQGAEIAVARALQRAAWAAGIREAVEHRWQGKGAAPGATCAACRGELPYRDLSADATHCEDNELVLRTPRGYYARVRAVLVETAEGATALPFHLTVAHAVDESGDVVVGEGGSHRIVDCGVRSIHVDQADVDWATGRPQSSLSAVLADIVLTEVLTRLEGAILSRAAYEKVAFLRRPPAPAAIV